MTDEALPPPKRQKLEDRKFEDLPVREVGWNTFRSDMFVVVRENLDSDKLIRLPVHGFQIALYPVFRTMLSESWDRAQDHIDMSGSDWTCPEWYRVLSFCYGFRALRHHQPTLLDHSDMMTRWWKFAKGNKRGFSSTQLFLYLISVEMDQFFACLKKEFPKDWLPPNEEVYFCWYYSPVCPEALEAMFGTETRRDSALHKRLLGGVVELLKNRPVQLVPLEKDPIDKKLVGWLFLLVALTDTADVDTWRSLYAELQILHDVCESRWDRKWIADSMDPIVTFSPCPKHCWPDYTREDQMVWEELLIPATHTSEFVPHLSTHAFEYKTVDCYFKFKINLKIAEQTATLESEFIPDEHPWFKFWKLQRRNPPQHVSPDDLYILECHSYQLVPK